MIFGNWKPLPILGASLFFALFKVIAALNATLTFLPKFEGVKEISNFYQMLPYIVTMIVLIFTSKNSQAPKAEAFPTTRAAVNHKSQQAARYPSRAACLLQGEKLCECTILSPRSATAVR